jgi:16S rRNA (cytidine1402-2'-O)-methyltransferase
VIPEKSSLYIVPTPIGNLGDITLRALEVLKAVDLILAEDTRKSGILLKHYNITGPTQSFHIFNEHKVTTGLVKRMRNGDVMALVSDAGTPGISDPGFLLVRETLKAGLKIDCLPGPNAFVPALLKSGFPCDRFIFEGFLPHKKGRQSLMKKLALEERTIIVYESPHRLVKSLNQWMEFLGTGRRVSVSRELSKIHEETFTGVVEDVITHFSKKEVKGEIVVVIEGKSEK